MKKPLLLLSFLLFGSKLFASNPTDMNCHCQGNGSYTFVFEAGMGNWSLFFQPLADTLSKSFRLCLLDRAGYSHPSNQAASADAFSIAYQMKQALAKAGIEDSMILVGHSIGGLNVRMFQSLFPEMVKGIILLDAAHPHLLEEAPEIQVNLKQQITEMRKIHRLAKLGLLGFAKKQIPTFGLPKEYHRRYYRIVTKAFYYQTYINEMKAFSENLSQCKKLKDLGNLPLLVISSKRGLNSQDKGKAQNTIPDTSWLKLQKELAALSTNSTFIESQGDHFVHLSDQDLVVGEIARFYSNHFNN